MLRHLVVERSPRLVGGLRLPVNPTSSCQARLRVHRFDELAVYTPAAQLRLGEEVLQIAHVFNLRCASVEEVVGKPGDVAMRFGASGEISCS